MIFLKNLQVNSEDLFTVMLVGWEGQLLEDFPGGDVSLKELSAVIVKELEGFFEDSAGYFKSLQFFQRLVLGDL